MISHILLFASSTLIVLLIVDIDTNISFTKKS